MTGKPITEVTRVEGAVLSVQFSAPSIRIWV